METSNGVMRCGAQSQFWGLARFLVLVGWMAAFGMCLAVFRAYWWVVVIGFLVLLAGVVYLFARDGMANRFEFDQKERRVRIRRAWPLGDRSFLFSEIGRVYADSGGTDGGPAVVMEITGGGCWTLMSAKDFKEAQREARGIVEFLGGAG